MDDVARLANRVFVMAEGKIVKSGTPEFVYADEGFLKNIGMGVPRATGFARRLVEGGLTTPWKILSFGDLLEALV